MHFVALSCSLSPTFCLCVCLYLSPALSLALSRAFFFCHQSLFLFHALVFSLFLCLACFQRCQSFLKICIVVVIQTKLASYSHFWANYSTSLQLSFSVTVCRS